MFCRNCGKQVVDGAKFCGACGTPIKAINMESPQQSQYRPSKFTGSLTQSLQPFNSSSAQSHTCPNCGANITNTKNCEFCGSLLVRFAEAGIDISTTTTYTSDASVFAGMQQTLDKHLQYAKENPGQYVQTNINGNLMVIVNTKSLDDFEGRRFFESAEVDGLGICIWFCRENSNEAIQVERFKELKSFTLFTHRITRRNELIGFDKDNNEVYALRTYDEYAIDFGIDSKSAARFCSEIIANVYNIPSGTTLTYCTETQAEKERKKKILAEKMNSSKSTYITCAVIFALVCITHFCFYVSDSAISTPMTWICLVVEIILGYFEESYRSTYKKCKLEMEG